jgi:hypothetical protein
MADRNENDNTSQAAVAEINRSIQAVTAEISARQKTHPTTRNRQIEAGDLSPLRSGSLNDCSSSGDDTRRSRLAALSRPEPS